ncbi:hypothetical protein ACFY5D_02075 [Paeniglutamicibacter sp. NPDC012692]|uniref:hypothetical protein n=1 Tax=Paeniglutamicibacter sp. NPDC012692 TaxID=3364388 RepID=UPI00369BB790
MPRTAGEKLGSLIIPLFLLAILTGVLAGAGLGAVLGLFLAIPMAANPEVSGVGSPGIWAVIPILYGIPVGGVAALVPAVGALIGLYVHTGKVPFPSTRHQALAAGMGASTTSLLLAVFTLIMRDANPPAALAVGVVFSIVSFLVTRLVAGKFLRHRAAREAGLGPA